MEIKCYRYNYSAINRYRKQYGDYKPLIFLSCMFNYMQGNKSINIYDIQSMAKNYNEYNLDSFILNYNAIKYYLMAPRNIGNETLNNVWNLLKYAGTRSYAAYRLKGKINIEDVPKEVVERNEFLEEINNRIYITNEIPYRRI